MTLRDRIWNDLRNTQFYIEYLSLLEISMKKFNRRIEIIFTFSTVASVVGINRFSDLNTLWSIILAIVVVLRVIKPLIFKSEKEIYTLERLRDFYIDHLRNLDDLWYNFENNKFKEKKIENLFHKYNEAERIIIKIEKHSRLNKNRKFEIKAEKAALQKLQKYY
jgi:hypothetical protein